MIIKGESGIRDDILESNDEWDFGTSLLCFIDDDRFLYSFDYINFAMINEIDSQIFGKIIYKESNLKKIITLFIQDIYFKKINKTNETHYYDEIYSYLQRNYEEKLEKKIIFDFAIRYWKKNKFVY